MLNELQSAEQTLIVALAYDNINIALRLPIPFTPKTRHRTRTDPSPRKLSELNEGRDAGFESG
jgi:hypothetical protein